MPRPIFEKKDDIPKGFEDEYEEKDGKWHPKPVDDGAALKETLRKERERADDAEKERKKLERRLAAAETGDEKDKVSKALAKFDEDLAAEKEAHKKELEKLQGELRSIRLDDRAKEAFIKAGGRPERADKALKLYKDALDLDKDGKRIVIKDDEGNVTTQTIDDFWGKKVRADLPDFYTGTKASGGGGKNDGLNPTPVPTDGKWDGDAVLKDPLGALSAANAAQTGS
jgi:seryl-tRNA synthetase